MFSAGAAWLRCRSPAMLRVTAIPSPPLHFTPLFIACRLLWPDFVYDLRYFVFGFRSHLWLKWKYGLLYLCSIIWFFLTLFFVLKIRLGLYVNLRVTIKLIYIKTTQLDINFRGIIKLIIRNHRNQLKWVREQKTEKKLIKNLLFLTDPANCFFYRINYTVIRSRKVLIPSQNGIK